MSELTRREFIGSVGSAAAMTALAPQASAAGGSTSAAGSSAAVISSSGRPSGPASPAYWNYQAEIYLDGLRGITPKITTNLSRLEAQAARVLSPRARKYLLADAGGREVVRANARAFRKWRIVPLMFRDHAVRHLSTTVLGTRMPAPVLFAPVGRQKLAHPDGELASARAAADLGLTYIHSAEASSSLEDVAAANGAGSRWYELHWPTKVGSEVSLLQRARAALYTLLVITLSRSDPDWRQLGFAPHEDRSWFERVLLCHLTTVVDSHARHGHRRSVRAPVHGLRRQHRWLRH